MDAAYLLSEWALLLATCDAGAHRNKAGYRGLAVGVGGTGHDDMQATFVLLRPTAGAVMLAFTVACGADAMQEAAPLGTVFGPPPAGQGPGLPAASNMPAGPMPAGSAGAPGMTDGIGAPSNGSPLPSSSEDDLPGLPEPAPSVPAPSDMMGDGGASGPFDTPGDQGDGGMPGPGEGDSPVPPKPSAGCGKANPRTGSSSNPLTDGKPYYVKLPTNYDPNTPYRLLFVFNPTGNPITWAENSAGYERLSAKDTAIRVYPHENPSDLARSPGGWSGDDVASFGPLYDAVVSNFCVDRERVFATGESSGGDFASVLGCEYGDKLRGVGPCATKPVNGYPLDASRRQCKGDVTAIVIHGANDRVVGPQNGPATRDFYTAINACGSASEPVEGYTDSLSNCVMFTGCKDNYPVYWCQHEDPEYGNTNHGWPKFAARMTWEIFEAY